MRNLILAGAAALALTAVPATAQPANAEAYDMTSAQQQMMMNWPDDARISYTRWPAEVQAYFWTLSPADQQAWWALTDDQRTRLYNMNPQQRTQAWTSIRSQLAGNPAATTTTTTPAAGSMSGNIQWVSNAVVQNIPAPHQGEYPVCNSDRDDNCMNPWEAGRRGPNVDKPLGYWPGKPASEM